MNTQINIQIIERKMFNSDGEIYTKYYVYFGDDCIASKDTLEEAQKVYNNVVNRTDDPYRIVIQETIINP
jgi:hypothetical protein